VADREDVFPRLRPGARQRGHEQAKAYGHPPP
jgi:hypothetical protein